MKTILSIIPFSLTQHDFYVMREPLIKYPSDMFFKKIPEWCVRANNGYLDRTKYYHQFTGQLDDDSKDIYYVFDVNPVDLLLQEEISNVGVDDFFIKFDWRN